jgi:N-acetylglucosamine kinase-like BadF-type ATPase
MPMSYFLGVNAGGTKTYLLLGDETHKLARHAPEPSGECEPVQRAPR